MFSYIKGNLEVKSNGFVVIDVNGMGFKIFMSEKGASVTLPGGFKFTWD